MNRWAHACANFIRVSRTAWIVNHAFRKLAEEKILYSSILLFFMGKKSTFWTWRTKSDWKQWKHFWHIPTKEFLTQSSCHFRNTLHKILSFISPKSPWCWLLSCTLSVQDKLPPWWAIIVIIMPFMYENNELLRHAWTAVKAIFIFSVCNHTNKDIGSWRCQNGCVYTIACILARIQHSLLKCQRCLEMPLCVLRRK